MDSAGRWTGTMRSFPLPELMRAHTASVSRPPVEASPNARFVSSQSSTDMDVIVAVSRLVPSAPKDWEPTRELFPGHSTTRPMSVAITMGMTIAASTIRVRRRSWTGTATAPWAGAWEGDAGTGVSSLVMGP